MTRPSAQNGEPKSPRYIALEGVDGSGKSTVAVALAAALEAAGERPIVVREPGGTSLGEEVRRLLLDSDSLDDWAEVMLFAAQRAQLAREVVAPALERGDIVISDRSLYSSIAYQGRARGLGEDAVREINERALDGVVPDLVIIIDVDPASALARQVDPDRIGSEGAGFQEKVRSAYVELARADPEAVVLMEGDHPVDSIVEAILERLS